MFSLIYRNLPPAEPENETSQNILFSELNIWHHINVLFSRAFNIKTTRHPNLPFGIRRQSLSLKTLPLAEMTFVLFLLLGPRLDRGRLVLGGPLRGGGRGLRDAVADVAVGEVGVVVDQRDLEPGHRQGPDKGLYDGGHVGPGGKHGGTGAEGGRGELSDQAGARQRVVRTRSGRRTEHFPQFRFQP